MAVHAESSIQLNTIPGYTSLFGGHFVYRSNDTIKQGITTTTAGAGIIQNLNSDPAQWGYNTWIGSNNIQLRRGEVADATLSTNGLVIAKGGVIAGGIGQDEGLYLSTEIYNTALQIGSSDINKKDWKLILGKNFGVDENGNLYASGGIIGNSNSYINITTEGIELTGSNVNIEVDSLNSVIDPDEWMQSHEVYKTSVIYSLTEDTIKKDNKNYYQKIEDYVLTRDLEVQNDKDYYIRSGTGTSEDPYKYTVVEQPVSENLNTYYEYIDYQEYLVPESGNPHELNLYEVLKSNTLTDYLNTHFNFTSEGLNIVANPTEYYITLAPDGMYVYNNDKVISKFGENIEFSSTLPQRIGDDNAYIQFTPADSNNNTPASIDIVATNIQIGSNTNVAEALAAQQEASQDAQARLQGQIDTQTEQINRQQQVINNIDGYVTINTSSSYIRVGKKNSNSYVQIDGNQLKVAINIDNKDVAYMAGDRFYAPSAVVSNLYMKTDLSSNSPIGAIGWVMRTNGHLSLKLIS